MVPREEHVGRAVHHLSRKIRRYSEDCVRTLQLDQVTAMNGWVLGYLYDHRDREVYQKDLETRFCIARSSVTAIMQHMEQCGYIRREGVARDARLKRVVLTPKGEETHLRIISVFDGIDEMLREGFTEEELDSFFGMLQKLGEKIDRAVKEE